MKWDFKEKIIFCTNITEDLEIHQQAILFDSNVFISDNKLYRKKNDITLYCRIFNALKTEKESDNPYWSWFEDFSKHLSESDKKEIISNNKWLNHE